MLSSCFFWKRTALSCDVTVLFNFANDKPQTAMGPKQTQAKQQETSERGVTKSPKFGRNTAGADQNILLKAAGKKKWRHFWGIGRKGGKKLSERKKRYTSGVGKKDGTDI